MLGNLSKHFKLTAAAMLAFLMTSGPVSSEEVLKLSFFAALG